MSVPKEIGAREAVIQPRRGRSESPVPPGMLTGFTPIDLALIRKGLGLSGRPARRVDLASLWECPAPRHMVGLAGPALGAPAAVMLLERLIALGAEAVVGVGSCGSLRPEISIGQIILPDTALVEEGTSAHYQGNHVRTESDPNLLQALREAFLREGLSPLVGRVWTTDAPFRETREKVTAYQREGILGVEMESSALMTAASFRRTPFASVLVVSDEIGTLKWKRGFDDPAYQETLARAGGIAAEVLAARVRSGSAGVARGETG